MVMVVVVVWGCACSRRPDRLAVPATCCSGPASPQLMDYRMVDFHATCVDAPDNVAVMDTIILSLRASLRREGTWPTRGPRPGAGFGGALIPSCRVRPASPSCQLSEMRRASQRAATSAPRSFSSSANVRSGHCWQSCRFNRSVRPSDSTWMLLSSSALQGSLVQPAAPGRPDGDRRRR